MGQLEDLRAFITIVEQQSIGGAAQQSGVAKSAMSRRLRLLEDRLGTSLIARTTRQWALTETGRAYYERGTSLLDAYDELETEVRHDKQKVAGDIRLSVPLYFGKFVIEPLLLRFAAVYPAVHLNVEFSDRFVDVIADGYDAVIRISKLADSRLIARQLCQTAHVYCASKNYLANNPTIVVPQDLKVHRILQYGHEKRPNWTFKSETGKEIKVPLKASLNSHDGGFLLAAAANDLGVVSLPDFFTAQAIREGRLLPVLEPFSSISTGVYYLYPASRYQPHRVRELLEFIKRGLSIIVPP